MPDYTEQIDLIVLLHKSLHQRFLWDFFRVSRRHQGSVTSLWRSEKHNKLVGGDETSWHREGLAGDVEFHSQSDFDNFVSDFRALGYRALHTGGNKIAAHGQYDWPIFRDFELNSHEFPHLKALVERYPQYIREDLETIKRKVLWSKWDYERFNKK